MLCDQFIEGYRVRKTSFHSIREMWECQNGAIVRLVKSWKEREQGALGFRNVAEEPHIKKRKI